MVVVPVATPVTIPLVEPMVATDGLLLVHVPPVVGSVRVVVAPTHTNGVPPIVPGAVLTVTTAVAVQMPPVVYVIVAVPAEIPVTVPEPEPMVAMAGLLLVHMPPVTALVRVVVAPTQTCRVPPMEAGVVTTVTIVVVTHAPML